MSYEEFIDYIKYRLCEELTVADDKIAFFPKGYTSTDPAILTWIKDTNIKYFRKESDTLLSDFLALQAGDDVMQFHRIAVKLLYQDAQKSDAESVVDKLLLNMRDSEDLLEESGAFKIRASYDYQSIKEHLIIRPLNYDLHLKDLKGCVYKRVGDFALVLYQYVGTNNNTVTSSKIQREELDSWGMSDKTDQVMQEALENTSRLFPACVQNWRINKTVDFLKSNFTRSEITGFNGAILLSTFQNTNGAVALFYPGVAEKLSQLMDGSFQVVFMNVNDLMVFPMKSHQLARTYLEIGSESNILGEVLSKRLYTCSDSVIRNIWRLT